MKKKTIIQFALIFVIAIIPMQAKKFKPIINEFWLTTAYKYEYNKKLALEYTYEQRFELNGDKEKSVYNEITPSYKIFKNLSIDAGLRLRTKESNTNMEYLSSLSYKQSLWLFDLSCRLRYHYKIENDNSSKDYLRVKFDTDYDFTNYLSLQVQTEFFYHFNYDLGDRFDKSRSGFELDWEFIKNWDLSAFWLYEHEFNIKKPNDTRVYGVSISLKFK